MVKIIADSTCDLTDELLARYDISICPLHIVLGEDAFKDRTELSPDDIYSWSDRTKQSPKTSAPNVAQIEEIIRPYYEQGHELILMSISESMSSTASNMHTAAQLFEEPERIHVVESANLSTGFGLLAIEAAILAKEGRDAAEIIRHIEALKPRIRSSFVVDTLTYLHRGGRCSSISALAGGVLKLHPKIVVQDGKMSAAQKYRGSMPRVISAYAEDMKADLLSANKERVFITHSGCSEASIQSVREFLESLGHFDEILITRAGGVISSHCGPGTLGILYIGQEDA